MLRCSRVSHHTWVCMGKPGWQQLVVSCAPVGGGGRRWWGGWVGGAAALVGAAGLGGWGGGRAAAWRGRRVGQKRWPSHPKVQGGNTDCVRHAGRANRARGQRAPCTDAFGTDLPQKRSPITLQRGSERKVGVLRSISVRDIRNPLHKVWWDWWVGVCEGGGQDTY